MEHTTGLSDDRYRVHDPVDVMAYLNEAASTHILCSVRATGHPESYLSRLFAIGPDADELVFDTPRAPVITRALMPGATATVELTLHHVRIIFDATVSRIAPYQNEMSLFLGLPESVLRLQRRENYRIGVPARRVVRLTLDAASPGLRDLKLADLSCGGASITLSGMLDEYPVGRVFPRARLILGDDIEFTVDVRVRHASATRLSGTIGDLRIGLQFLRTPPGFEPAVARLVNDIARDQGHVKRR